MRKAELSPECGVVGIGVEAGSEPLSFSGAIICERNSHKTGMCFVDFGLSLEIDRISLLFVGSYGFVYTICK